MPRSLPGAPRPPPRAQASAGPSGCGPWPRPRSCSSGRGPLQAAPSTPPPSWRGWGRPASGIAGTDSGAAAPAGPPARARRACTRARTRAHTRAHDDAPLHLHIGMLRVCTHVCIFYVPYRQYVACAHRRLIYIFFQIYRHTHTRIYICSSIHSFVVHCLTAAAAEGRFEARMDSAAGTAIRPFVGVAAMDDGQAGQRWPRARCRQHSSSIRSCRRGGSGEQSAREGLTEGRKLFFPTIAMPTVDRISPGTTRKGQGQ